MNETNNTNYIGKTVGSQGYYGIEKLGKVILMRTYRGCPLIRIETGEEFLVNEDIVIIDEEKEKKEEKKEKEENTVTRLKEQKERVEFSWTWEVVENDRVVTYIDWEGDAPKGYETLTEWSQDNGGITYARKWAKKWARQNDRKFYEEKLSTGGNAGYGAAVLAAYRAENG